MYLGVAYYPEYWDQNMIDDDLQRIKEMGANIVRIGEFSWHLMEPKEGEYDFSYFDQVIQKAKGHGLKVIFGTPTATFPAWLAKKHPTILSKDEWGHTRVFGGRRQYCYNSKVYQSYSTKIVERLVDHYKNEEAIVAWQIDNELGHEGSDFCYCEQCQIGYQEYLEEKYEEIEELNQRYGTIFWGQTYNEFSEIPIPMPTITTHNPSLRLDWARYRSHSINRFGKMQIDIVNQYKGQHQEVTHNFYGGFFEKAYDQNVLAEQLDFVSYDNYPVWGGMSKPLAPAQIAMTLDYIRGLKGKNFWIVEEIIGAQGHNVIGYLPRPNQAKMWAHQAMGHGCENLLFFNWRSMTRGSEQFCYGIIDHDDEEGRKYQEVKSFYKEIGLYEEVIRSKIISEIAILYDFDNIWSWEFQQQSSDFHFTDELVRLYTPFYQLNTNIDVINTHKSFLDYRIVVVPVMQIIDEELASRCNEFVKNGGILIFSFRSGIKDRDNNIHFKQMAPGYIREIAGIRIKETEALALNQMVEIVGEKGFAGKIGHCSVWRDLIEPITAMTLYRYNDKFYQDKACVTVNDYGKGKVYYIGGGIDSDNLIEIMRRIVRDHHIHFIESPEGLEVYRRISNNEEWLFINNHTDQKVIFKGIEIKAFGSKIIKGT